MRPLKVTCWLNSPLAGDPPRLDALLEWVMSAKMRAVLESSNGARHATGMPKHRGQPVVPGAIPIPLARVRVDGYPHTIPLCSDPIMAEVQSDGVEHFTRRFPSEMSALLAPTERKIVTVDAGANKSYRLPLRIRLVDRIVWFCCGRDKIDTGRSAGTETRKLLRDVHSIGKKTSDGYGQVARWEVELTDEDFSWFAPSSEGPVLMRTIPASAKVPDKLRGFKRSYGAPVAPYWMAENYTELLTPC